MAGQKRSSKRALLKRIKEALPGGETSVACQNFKMPRVGNLSRLHNAVRNLATYICLCQSLVMLKRGVAVRGGLIESQ